MREAFVQEAILVVDAGADERAPGAAVTVALCGHWDHPPPCPLAPHHTRAERVGAELRLRVLFATDPRDEPEVRRRIEQALRGGSSTGPDGVETRWRLRTTRPGRVTPSEARHAARLIQT
ncbi:hypothetical protein [Sphaerisporangium sp. TRM90804]|uniref:hypothetical protein n=1 Tax=Sphaerisporangium sp. TRM90804 TaxID=3031113 RepID=UPI00244A923B|nr:hypothetical protein [Sphaerisporangium sp. TRM90804]MDH2428482.1 hypothetical protein [Sphaerisporangium sp. TRM90804]